MTLIKTLIKFGLCLALVLANTVAFAQDEINVNEVLAQCAPLQAFEGEFTAFGNDGKFICRETIMLDLYNGENPSHPLFNSEGLGVISTTGPEGEELSINGCCYDNVIASEKDLDNDCKIEESNGEQCLIELKRQELRQDCICAEDPFNDICLEQYTCQAGITNPIVTGADGEIKPFESEFFDVTDPESGLTTSDQGDTFLAGRDADQGPIFTVVNRVINLLVGLVSTVALVILVIGSYMLITAQGEENQIEKGKNAIKYSLLGIVFVLLSFTIVRLVQSIFF